MNGRKGTGLPGRPRRNGAKHFIAFLVVGRVGLPDWLFRWVVR